MMFLKVTADDKSHSRDTMVMSAALPVEVILKPLHTSEIQASLTSG